MNRLSLTTIALGLLTVLAWAQLPGSSEPVRMAVRTMSELDGERPLNVGDQLLYRVIEDQDPPVVRRILDSGEIEVPYLGRWPAAGMTCRQLAEAIKSELEKELYKQATVLITRDKYLKGKGKIYVMGKVRNQGPVDIPEGEIFTVSKAILAVGGFSEFADEGKVRLIRRTGSAPEDVKEIIVT
jgi:protein involved in polysaccharide export with SLBB domain